MKNVKAKVLLKDTLCLFIICLVITFAVAGTRSVFADRIAKQALAQTQAAMERLIQADDYKEMKLAGENEGYQAVNQKGKTLGYLFVTQSAGYGDDVRVMSAIKKGEVVGVEVLDASEETPGLGQNVTENEFLNQFAGADSSLAVVKEEPTDENQIEAVTGATISSTAVTESVQKAFDLYEQVTHSNE